MNKKRFFWGVCLGVVFFLLGTGLSGVVYQARTAKDVVFRVSNSKAEMDYDFLAALAYLKYRFNQNGYRVLGTAYGGELYPKRFNQAQVNVYVRGFWPFYDLRRNDEAADVYYIHRIMEIYREEMQGYDYYLSSQKGLDKAVKEAVNLDFLESGAVPHEKLEPTYDKDVLYIYEYGNRAYEAFLRENLQAKVYSGRAFAALSEEGQKKELSSARLVVYEMGDAGADDKDYVPYAVYDVMSYGRPVLTNYKVPLEQMFYNDVHLFKKREDMKDVTLKALEMSDQEREQRAQAAREKLLGIKNENRFFMKE